MYTLFKHSASPSSVYISWLEDFFSPMFSRPFRFLRSSEMLFVYSINSSGVSIALCWCDDLFQPRFCFRRLNGRKRPSLLPPITSPVTSSPKPFQFRSLDSKLINRSMQRKHSAVGGIVVIRGERTWVKFIKRFEFQIYGYCRSRSRSNIRKYIRKNRWLGWKLEYDLHCDQR